jgi:hypothetical protein
MSWCILVVLVATLPVASKREIDKAHREASVLCKFVTLGQLQLSSPTSFALLVYRIITCRTWLLQECAPNAFRTGTRTVIQKVSLYNEQPCDPA